MKVTRAEFVSSASALSNCPPPVYPEYAFVGRSNVGKSSLINMLAGVKGLAKISSDPGKTRLINFFRINTDWFLVDLPGYGYARIGKEHRAKFQQMIQNYLLRRKSLLYTFVLIDSRHEPMKADLDFINWLGKNAIPFCIVFTKVDKGSNNQTNNTILAYKNTLAQTWEELPVMFSSSSKNAKGKEEILGFIDEANKAYQPEINSLQQPIP